MAEINEAVADAAMEVAETATNVAEISRGISKIEVRYLVAGVAIGCGVGCAIGYRVAKKRLETIFARQADAEIEDMRVVFEDLRAKKDAEIAQSQDNEAKLRLRLHEEVTGPKPELDNVMEHLGYKSPDDMPHIREVRPNVHVVVEEPQESKGLHNVFDHPSMAEEVEVWDYSKEVKARTPDAPYIIHADEHEAGEKGYEQTTLTYYEDDDVLADEEDSVIDHSVVGMENLTRFGHGSSNPDLLFVRNDVLEVDYEIAKSTGSYAQEVHGFKHAETDRRRRRDWDG